MLDKTFYCKISQSLEVVRWVLKVSAPSEILQAHPTVKFQSDAIIQTIDFLARNFTRSCDKTPYRILKQGLGPDFIYYPKSHNYHDYYLHNLIDLIQKSQNAPAPYPTMPDSEHAEMCTFLF